MKLIFPLLFSTNAFYANAFTQSGIHRRSDTRATLFGLAATKSECTGRNEDEEFLKEYNQHLLNPDYWMPKSKNFEIIDWKKWEAKNPAPPKVFDPPQRRNSRYLEKAGDAMIWWHRSTINSPDTSKGGGGGGPKPNTGNISDENLQLFKSILGGNPDSSNVPKPFRNALLWMEHNEAPEALVSFNRFAWRSNTNEGRSVGLGSMRLDWTNSPNAFGQQVLAKSTKDSFLNFQVSPDGKWIKAFVTGGNISGHPSDPEGLGFWLDMYIVQEGDEFVDRNGVIMADVEPGDIYRITFNDGSGDPYVCGDSNISLTSFARKVAILDEETGDVAIHSPHYENMVKCALRAPSEEMLDLTQDLTDSSLLDSEEKWDFQVTHISDTQIYSSAPTPPFGADIEDLGVTISAVTVTNALEDANIEDAIPESLKSDIEQVIEEQTTSTREQLASLQKSIDATKEQYAEKKEKYETALYEMDAEFVGQTETIRKDFEKKLEKIKTELKGNYKKKLTEAKDIFQKENELKLVEQEGKVRQGYLAEKMNYEQQFNEKSAEDAFKALNRQSQLVSENQSLKDSLSKVQADLEEIMKIKKGLLG